jgi:voltage-gated potassium channel
MLSQIQSLKNHFVICGCGRIGRYVLNELRVVKAPVVVIEQDQHVIDELSREGVLCLQGSGADEETLVAANITTARGLVVTVATDAETVFIILTARDLNPNLFVIARAIEEKNEDKLRRAGAARVISPYRFIGQRLAGSLLHPAVVDMLDTVLFGGELDLGMEGVIVERGSPLAGLALRDSGIRDKLGLMIIGIRKAEGNMLFNPTADEVIEPGDTLISMGDKRALKKLNDFLAGAIRRL